MSYLYSIRNVFILCIFLFSFSALRNQFGATGVRDKIDVEEDDPDDIEEPEESITEEDNVEEDIIEKISIELEIYEGPLFSEATNICYYRIEAIVTGDPEPVIEFNKDDSNGAWGPKKVQVNINDPDAAFIRCFS